MPVVFLVAVQAAEAILRQTARLIDIDESQTALIYVCIGPRRKPQPIGRGHDIAFIIQTDMAVHINVPSAIHSFAEGRIALVFLKKILTGKHKGVIAVALAQFESQAAR